MYNVWFNKREEKLYHVIAEVAGEGIPVILVSREGIVNYVRKDTFLQEYVKTPYSLHVQRLKTPYLSNFNFNTLEEYSDYIMERSDASDE